MRAPAGSGVIIIITMDEHEEKKRLKKVLLIINCIILCIGTTGGPLVQRLYFLHGGSRIWLSSWLETCLWPLIFIPLIISYYYRRAHNPDVATEVVLMKPFLFGASAVIGILNGIDDYLYSSGVSRLPVSTSSLIIASQLAFTAGFAFLLVKQRFTSYTVNSIFLLTIGAVVLALNTGSDRPEGESSKEYVLGFIMTIAAAVLYSFILPLVELTYMKAKQVITYTLVLEIQLVICFFATAFCTVGMLINKDFQAIPREARESDIGEGKYYVVLFFIGFTWQCFFLGIVGVIFCSSSLFSGVMIAVLLPITEILAVIFYKEKFHAEKGVSLALSLWGFVSYFYGEMKLTQQKSKIEDQRKLLVNNEDEVELQKVKSLQLPV